VSINGTYSSDKNDLTKSLGILRDAVENKLANSVK
jgi:hypothetical protein